MLIAKRKVSTQKLTKSSRKVGRDNIAHAHEFYVAVMNEPSPKWML